MRVSILYEFAHFSPPLPRVTFCDTFQNNIECQITVFLDRDGGIQISTTF